jgi:hypothetical protein
VTRDIIFIFLAVQLVRHFLSSSSCVLYSFIVDNLHIDISVPMSICPLYAGDCFTGIFGVFYRWLQAVLASSGMGF